MFGSCFGVGLWEIHCSQRSLHWYQRSNKLHCTLALASYRKPKYASLQGEKSIYVTIFLGGTIETVAVFENTTFWNLNTFSNPTSTLELSVAHATCSELMLCQRFPHQNLLLARPLCLPRPQTTTPAQLHICGLRPEPQNCKGPHDGDGSHVHITSFVNLTWTTCGAI